MVNAPCTRYHVLGTLRPSHKIPEDLPYPSVFGSVISNQERTSSFYTLAKLHMRTVSIIYMSICNERKLNYMFYARQLIKRLLRGAQVDFLSVYTWAIKCNVCVIYQVKIKNKRKPCADLEGCQESPDPRP